MKIHGRWGVRGEQFQEPQSAKSWAETWVQAVLFPSFPDLKWKFHSWVGCNAQLWGVGEQRTHGNRPGVGGSWERNVRAGLLRAECPPAVALSLQPCTLLPPALPPPQASDLFSEVKTKASTKAQGRALSGSGYRASHWPRQGESSPLSTYTSCLPHSWGKCDGQPDSRGPHLGMHRVRCGSLTMDFALLPPLEGCGSGSLYMSTHSYFFFLIFFLVALRGLWDLSSSIRDWTQALVSESIKS